MGEAHISDIIAHNANKKQVVQAIKALIAARMARRERIALVRKTGFIPGFRLKVWAKPTLVGRKVRVV